MKKTSTLIAMFAVIAAASSARAQISVDFDNSRGARANLSGAQRIVVFDPDSDPTPIPVPLPDPSPNPMPLPNDNTPMIKADEQAKMYGLKSENGKALYSLLAGQHFQSIGQEMAEQIRDNKVSVLYNKEKVYLTRPEADDIRILTLESRDQALLGMIIKASRGFPSTRWDEPDGVPTGVGNKLCAEYVTNEVCQNRKVCRVVTTAGGSYGGLLGVVIGAVAGEYVCEWVPECSTVKTCIRWE